MSFRTVVITKQSKISYKNRFLVVKQEDNEKYIHLSEIDTVIVDSISVSISSYLLKELADNKINIIFCDEKHNPFGELVPYYSKHNTSKMIKEQIKWKQSEKDKLWAEIVKNKIMNQALLLKKIKSSKYKLVLSYVNEVVDGDKTNREGHAAKVYFNALYGNNFVRNQDEWDYVRLLPHIWDDSNTVRFFASSRSDVNEISQFLEEEIAERIQNDENNSGEKEFDYKKTGTYYLIITDNYRELQDTRIFNTILEHDENLGFSLLCVSTNIAQLPNK